jgi:hypothetical protein
MVDFSDRGKIALSPYVDSARFVKGVVSYV